jgi:hypothetical protein
MIRSGGDRLSCPAEAARRRKPDHVLVERLRRIVPIAGLLSRAGKFVSARDLCRRRDDYQLYVSVFCSRIQRPGLSGLVSLLAWGGTALLALRSVASIIQTVYLIGSGQFVVESRGLWELWFYLGATLFGLGTLSFWRDRVAVVQLDARSSQAKGMP